MEYKGFIILKPIFLLIDFNGFSYFFDLHFRANYLLLIGGLFFLQCQSPVPFSPLEVGGQTDKDTIEVAEVIPLPVIEKVPPPDYDTTKWTELIRLDSQFIINLKYATEDNFVEAQLYDCPRCFLDPAAAQALLEVQRELLEQDLRLMLFDCYRPWSVQQALWDIMPNASYVTPPKRGSMHNRGLAVDLTIATLAGDTLEMGTPFDYFGPRGHHTYQHHTVVVQNNRNLLKSTMEKYGFRSIRTEWWHYNFRGVKRKTSDMVWSCDHPAKQSH